MPSRHTALLSVLNTPRGLDANAGCDCLPCQRRLRDAPYRCRRCGYHGLRAIACECPERPCTGPADRTPGCEHGNFFCPYCADGGFSPVDAWEILADLRTTLESVPIDEHGACIDCGVNLFRLTKDLHTFHDAICVEQGLRMAALRAVVQMHMRMEPKTNAAGVTFPAHHHESCGGLPLFDTCTTRCIAARAALAGDARGTFLTFFHAGVDRAYRLLTGGRSDE